LAVHISANRKTLLCCCIGCARISQLNNTIMLLHWLCTYQPIK
jgi:hypothetical protein